MSLGKLFLLTVAATALVADADGLRESEVAFASDLELAEVDQAIDLRSCWPVETLGEIEIQYSAVGWDLTPQPAGASVRLNLLDGMFADGVFHPGTDGRDLATGLTGSGVYKWQPSVDLKGYRILHETTRDGQVVDDGTLSAYFDFSECEMVTETEFRGAVLGNSQPIVAVDDIRHPWSRIGGDGDGLRNDADGATLSFSFMGAGSFAANLSFADGTVTVSVDGETVETVSANAAWTAKSWQISVYDMHTVTLTYGGSSGVSVKECALTDINVRCVDCRETAEAPCDLRMSFPVANLEGDPALRGLMYSAFGFERGAAADASRTATITARAGFLAGGVFTADGSPELNVLPRTAGEGTVDWRQAEISKKFYQLVHTVRAGDVVDEGGFCYGYLDFTHCVSYASQADVEAAVLGAITHRIAVVQDEVWPWQPIDSAAARSGLVSGEWLEPGDETATTFTFSGRGTLHYEYDLTGGTLEVIADGAVVSTFNEATADWMPCQVSFDGYGAHEASFVYSAVGSGATAGIRNVRWEEQPESSRSIDEGEDVCVDLREGVRKPKRLAEVLPFQYSSTNWVGFVDGESVRFSAESVARMTIVELAGTDPDARNWTEEVPGTFRELVRKIGEGETRWRPKKGVWKATLDISGEDGGSHAETAIFDLRDAHGVGLMLFLK